MLKSVRQKIVHSLWETYLQSNHDMQTIIFYLQKKNIFSVPLDHFAIIDLPSANTSISILSQLFSLVGYVERGKDYLPDKQNDFLWMAEGDCQTLPAKEVLPQAVVADFRLQELPNQVREIITKYASQTKPSPLALATALTKETRAGSNDSALELTELMIRYFSGREWPLPTIAEFKTVHQFNELIAWVLIFGRIPNHFTLSIHHLAYFNTIAEFHDFIENEVGLALNQENGKIKGGREKGLAQGSTLGRIQTVKLSDGEIELPNSFIEFVWRYPRESSSQFPFAWDDYFNDFIPQHANHVIESLYLNEKEDILSKVQG